MIATTATIHGIATTGQAVGIGALVGTHGVVRASMLPTTPGEEAASIILGAHGIPGEVMVTTTGDTQVAVTTEAADLIIITARHPGAATTLCTTIPPTTIIMVPAR